MSGREAPVHSIIPSLCLCVSNILSDAHFSLGAEVSKDTGEALEAIREEAAGILEEMSQDLQLGYIRFLGFILSKVFKRLFRKINVNEEGLQRVIHGFT